MKRLAVVVAGLLVIGFTAFGCSSWPPAQGNAGWTTLFDGASLDNWNQIGNANWRLADGVVQATKATAFSCRRTRTRISRSGRVLGRLRRQQRHLHTLRRSAESLFGTATR